MTPAHRWETVEEYGSFTKGRCRVCLCIRHSVAEPGWGTRYTFFNRDGVILLRPDPPCAPNPVEGLFGDYLARRAQTSQKDTTK